jgi:hypothetical protein
VAITQTPRPHPSCTAHRVRPSSQPILAPSRCDCGRPLHYSDPAIQLYVERAIAELGETLPIATPTGTWCVPRHYYALHGLTMASLPRLARLHHWKKEPQ